MGTLKKLLASLLFKSKTSSLADDTLISPKCLRLEQWVKSLFWGSLCIDVQENQYNIKLLQSCSVLILWLFLLIQEAKKCPVICWLDSAHLRYQTSR
jgi:hypothetical protein